MYVHMLIACCVLEACDARFSISECWVACLGVPYMHIPMCSGNSTYLKIKINKLLMLWHVQKDVLSIHQKMGSQKL